MKIIEKLKKIDPKYAVGLSTGLTVAFFASAAVHAVANRFYDGKQKGALLDCYTQGIEDGSDALVAGAKNREEGQSLLRVKMALSIQQIGASNRCAALTPQ